MNNVVKAWIDEFPTSTELTLDNIAFNAADTRDPGIVVQLGVKNCAPIVVHFKYIYAMRIVDEEFSSKFFCRNQP